MKNGDQGRQTGSETFKGYLAQNEAYDDLRLKALAYLNHLEGVEVVLNQNVVIEHMSGPDLDTVLRHFQGASCTLCSLTPESTES